MAGLEKGGEGKRQGAEIDGRLAGWLEGLEMRGAIKYTRGLGQLTGMQERQQGETRGARSNMREPNGGNKQDRT